ncbi:MAG: PAS domain-containing protein, partial [Oscillospiraceae bacterium]|nr:PAS domain-containing protein [Oscillospiraceae bacterium]
FPLWFIDQRMLEYLGYDGEAGFIQDTGGLIVNCVHPDDRESAAREIRRQIAASGSYAVECRIKKKNGSYLWVHGVGRKTQVQDGREAILSVCGDITPERERANIFEQLLTSMNGGVALYQIRDGKAAVQYISPGVSAILGLTEEEYRRRYGADVTDSIYKDDRAMMRKAVQAALYSNEPASLTYRSPHGDGGYVWVNGVFSRHSASDGETYLRAVFYPASRQFAAQLQILDQTASGVYIFDQETYELYYCNTPGFRLLGAQPCDYTGKSCHEALRGSMEPCGFCRVREALDTQRAVEMQIPGDNRFFTVRARKINWNGRPAVLEYLTEITEAKLAEEKFRRSEEITEAASAFAGMWIWTFEVQTGRAHCYKLLREEYGLPEYLDGFPESWMQLGFISPEDAEVYRSSVERVSQGEESVSFECKGYLSDGSEHWMRCRFNRLPGQPGEPAVVVCTAQQIDWEKALEARVTLEQQKPIVNQKSLLGYLVTNLSSGRILLCRAARENVALAQDGTLQVDAVRGFSENILDAGQRELFLQRHDPQYLQRFYSQGGVSDVIEFRARQLDGRSLWVRNTLEIQRDPVSGDMMLYEYYYDSDDEQKERLAVGSLLDEEVDYLCIIGVQSGRGRLIRADAQFMRDDYWQNFPYDGEMERMIAQRIVEEDRERCRKFLTLSALIGLLDREKSAAITYFAGTPAAPRRKKIRVFYLDENREDIVLARSDITDIYQEEQKQKNALRKALDAANQGSRAKSEFLSQMSHEIRTPMNAIMGMTKLAEDVVTDPQAAEYLKKIDASSEYLLGILNNVLDMSRIESGRLTLSPEWISAESLLRDCVRMAGPMAEEKGIRFLAPDTERVRPYEYFLDPLRIKQVMMNLLGNAVKFTPPGGTVTLSASARQSSAELCTEEIVISDTGCGMSEEFLQKAFMPFEQERNQQSDLAQGTGLGLALVKEIVDAMGGEISVKSRLGEGAAFTVTLPHPYRLAAKKAPAQRAPETGDALEGRRVLLVDDHPLNREIAKKLLIKKGVQVELAADGREALQLVSSSSPGYYDGVLMDIRMPLMDGLEAARRIRRLDREDIQKLPVIAMTANAFDEDIQHSREAGMNAHLAKPIDPEILYRTLAEQICRAQGQERCQ